MELIPSITTTTATTSGGGGGGGGPAPFLLKTYEMVDDSSTDDIVSWSSNNTSFIVWNPPEFARVLLPTYFKHNNFSSFIRQLNTYGFHKIDAEKWEFANEDFVKDEKHPLKKIYRRKPIHSHSHPPPDPERVAFEEEIEKLTREKNELDTKVLSFRMQESAAKSQLDDITYRLSGMEQRQEKLLTFLQKAVQDPIFVEHLAHKIEAMDLSAYNKKRRLPRVDNILPAADHSFGEYQSSCRPEVATTFHLDMSNKLNLELSTAVPNSHAVSNSTHSSNEDWASPPRKSPGADMKDVEMGVNTLPFSSENVELSDAGSCLSGLAFKMDSSLSDRVGAKESAGSQSLPQLAAEESDGLICCQLNLSLASSPIITNQNPSSVRLTLMDKDLSGTVVVRTDASVSSRNESGVADKNSLLSKDAVNLSMSQETMTSNRNPTPAAPPRVNDHFWEQFLTERPGSTDTEEASSCYRAPHDEQEDRGSSHGMSRTANNLGKLTL